MRESVMASSQVESVAAVALLLFLGKVLLFHRTAAATFSLVARWAAAHLDADAIPSMVRSVTHPIATTFVAATPAQGE